MAMRGGPLSVSATWFPSPSRSTSLSLRRVTRQIRFCDEKESLQVSGENVNDPGVKVALSVLKFYKREISPLLPRSCRYVPTCSEYSMEAYKKYGVVKGSILTAWRICRCNPIGGYGFDPPRWFGEEREEPSEF